MSSSATMSDWSELISNDRMHNIALHLRILRAVVPLSSRTPFSLLSAISPLDAITVRCLYCQLINFFTSTSFSRSTLLLLPSFSLSKRHSLFDPAEPTEKPAAAPVSTDAHSALPEPRSLSVTRFPTNPPFQAHLGNINENVTEDELMELFKEYNPLKVRIGMKDGKRMNYAFVDVSDAATLKKLIADGPKELNSETIPVALGLKNRNGVPRRGGGWSVVEKRKTGQKPQRHYNDKKRNGKREGYGTKADGEHPADDATKKETVQENHESTVPEKEQIAPKDASQVKAEEQKEEKAVPKEEKPNDDIYDAKAARAQKTQKQPKVEAVPKKKTQKQTTKAASTKKNPFAALGETDE